MACALLGELLYERGEVDEADRLLDESYQLGAEGGGVEFMIARYVTGARIKAVRGDRDAAAARLDGGAHVAATIGLPRLRAHVDNERMRLDLPLRSETVAQEKPLPDGGLGEITAQLRDEAEIRGLLADQPGLACERARGLGATARNTSGVPARSCRPTGCWWPPSARPTEPTTPSRHWHTSPHNAPTAE